MDGNFIAKGDICNARMGMCMQSREDCKIYIVCVERHNVSTTQMTSFSVSLHVLENVLTSSITHSYAAAGNIFSASHPTHSMSLKKYSTYKKKRLVLTFKHCASSIQDRRFTTLQRMLFIYLINKYISLSDICLTVHH